MRWIFGLAFAAALAVSATALGFFVWGLADGSVSASNGDLWLLILVGVTALPALGWHLRSRGRLWPAVVVLSVLAVPGLLYALIIVLAVTSGTSWN